MHASTVTARTAQAENAVSLVLKAERAALTKVEQYQREMHELVAASSLRSKQLQQRNEERIRHLHERMTAAARERQARIGSEIAALASDMGTDGFILARLDEAIVRATEEIAGIPKSS